MQLRHIELFQAIMQSGSLTAAANLLCISQPAASKSLKHAEQQIGFSLFTRVRGRLEPTQEALVLSRETERLTYDLEGIRRLSENLRRGGERSIRLIGTPALVQALIPKTISRWRETFPNGSCELASHHTHEIIRSLLLREADIGLTFQPVTHPDLESSEIGEGSLMVIAPSGWWAPSVLDSPLHIEELSDTPIIALDSNDMLGRTLYNQLLQLPLPPRINTWVQTYQLARQLTSLGQGLSLVDPLTAQKSCHERLQSRPLEPRVPVKLYALCRVDKTHGPAERHMLNLAGEVAAKLLLGTEASGMA